MSSPDPATDPATADTPTGDTDRTATDATATDTAPPPRWRIGADWAAVIVAAVLVAAAVVGLLPSIPFLVK